MTAGPLFTYRQRLAEGSIRPDLAQECAINKLQSLWKALTNYQPAPVGGGNGGGWLARFGLGAKRETAAPGLAWVSGDGVAALPKRGLYIYGEVGRGKSMLMDLFFETATVKAKRRLHFHEFMQEVQRELHAWRKTKDSKEADPLPRLARQIAERCWLLCLDEMQVTDIGDAMIVGRLFQGLLDQGVVVVTTSNRHPSDLYKDGLQRDRFLPFIKLLEAQLDILELNSERDYRLGRKRGMQVFHTPLGPQAEADLDACFARLTGGQPAKPDEVVVLGRTVPVPAAADGVARFTFEDLCGRPLGPADYLELATLFHTIMISGVPILSPERRDVAKRFVTLIDAMYEHKCLLVCSAAAVPEALYPTGDGAFEFQRTVSRLQEMQSADYIAREHLT